MWCISQTGRIEAVPAHTEISELLAEKIRRNLSTPEPQGCFLPTEAISPLGAFPIFLSTREKGDKESSNSKAFGVSLCRTLKCQIHPHRPRRGGEGFYQLDFDICHSLKRDGSSLHFPTQYLPILPFTYHTSFDVGPSDGRIMSNFFDMMSNFFDMLLSPMEPLSSRRQMPDFGNHVEFFRHAHPNMPFLFFFDLFLFPLDTQSLIHIIKILALS